VHGAGWVIQKAGWGRKIVCWVVHWTWEWMQWCEIDVHSDDWLVCLVGLLMHGKEWLINGFEWLIRWSELLVLLLVWLVLIELFLFDDVAFGVEVVPCAMAQSFSVGSNAMYDSLFEE
jgi:hypothetical protein